jgi:hypothetical protein
MSMQDFFLEGMSNETERAQLIKSELWPLVTATINATDGKLRVGFIRMSGWQSVCMVNSVGFAVATITNTDKCRMHLMYEGVDPDGGWLLMKSKHAKYMVRKLRKPKEGAVPTSEYTSLLNAIKKVENTLDSLLRSVLVNSTYSAYPNRSTPSAPLDEHLATILLRLYKGHLNPIDIPSQSINSLDHAFNRYLNSRESFETAFKSCRDLFNSDKWVLIYDYQYCQNIDSPVRSSVIVGAVSRQPALAAINRYMNEGQFPMNNLFTYSDITHPLKWYPSFEHIPDEIRKEIEIQLMMYKVNRQSSQLLPRPVESFVQWTDGGIACYAGGHSHARMVIVDKSS